MTRLTHSDSSNRSKIGVLFVCTANICRSPMAEGAFRQSAIERGLLQHFDIDSVGVICGIPGTKPDPHAVAAASDHGCDISEHRSRQLVAADFERFDYLLAMDDSHMDVLSHECPRDFSGRLDLLGSFSSIVRGKPIEDPMFDDSITFDSVFRIVRECGEKILDAIESSNH